MEQKEVINYIRPQTLKDFIGKPEVIKSLRVGVEVSRITKNALDHMLFYGPPGVGKTSLAQIIANEMNVKIKIIQSTNLQCLPDLIGVLNSLKDFDILFLDEIHSLKQDIAEILYPALEDNVIDVVIGKHYNSKVIRVNLPKFTLIAATTNFGHLTKALEERFGYVFFLDVYNRDELFQIIKRSEKNWNLVIPDSDIEIIIQNVRGIPRNCNRILKRLNDYKIIQETININDVIKECGFIHKGLTEIDIKYLKFLKSKQFYTAGFKSLMQGINLDEKTLIYKIEPYLVTMNYINKDIKGRSLTKEGLKILKEYTDSLKKIS